MTDLSKLESLRREHSRSCDLVSSSPTAYTGPLCTCGASEHNRVLDECVEEERARQEAERWRKWPEEEPASFRVYLVYGVDDDICDAEYERIFSIPKQMWIEGWLKEGEIVLPSHWRPLPSAPEGEE